MYIYTEKYLLLNNTAENSQKHLTISLNNNKEELTTPK